MNEYKFKFSVIIPIYNVEKYLEETILSVINQTIGFKENIQLILINDGSKDKSYKICEKYKKLYSDNIIYDKQENQGVSAARNKGMEYIEGKYANFLDSDDIWDLDVFEKVYKFFEKHEKDIDVISCRQKLFEAKEGYHQLDYKFESNRIIDIQEDFEYIQLSTSSAFLKSDIVKKYKYDERLKYAEDATLVGQVIMEKSKYGILSDAIYNYRKRKKNTSALQTREGDKSWYFDTIKYGYDLLISKSIEKYGKVIHYFQYQIMYDLQWRLKVDISKYLNQEEKEKYIKEIVRLLSYIDDEIIMQQKYLWKEYKVLALCLKYNKDIRQEFYYDNNTVCFDKIKIFNIKSKSLFKIEKIKFNGKNLKIKGIINIFVPEKDYEIYIKINNKNKEKIETTKKINNRQSIVGNLNNCKEVYFNIPIKDEPIELKIIIDYKNEKKILNISIKQFSNIEYEDICVYAGKGIVIEKKKNKIQIVKCNGKEIREAQKKVKELRNKNKELENMDN
mgnify:FL=1